MHTTHGLFSFEAKICRSSKFRWFFKLEFWAHRSHWCLIWTIIKIGQKLQNFLHFLVQNIPLWMDANCKFQKQNWKLTSIFRSSLSLICQSWCMRIFHSFIGILLLFLLKIRQHPPKIKITWYIFRGEREQAYILDDVDEFIPPHFKTFYWIFSCVCATKFSFLHHLLFLG